MNFHIYGKGFGLYGYFSALAKNRNYRIFINEKYYQFIKSRKELNKNINKINFVKKHIVKKKDFIIYARRPVDQHKFLKKNAIRKNYFFLEKPVSNNIKNSKKITNFLLKKKINFSVGYLFIYTSWYTRLLKITKKKNLKEITINWNFSSVNKSESWKRKNKLGGGIINFYGTHIFALITALKFNNLNFSNIYKKNKIENIWFAEFSNKDNVKFIVKLNINSKRTNFKILYNLNKRNLYQKILFNNKYPFISKNKDDDYRVEILKKYINHSIKFGQSKSLHLKILNIWNKVSKNNKIIKL